MNCSGDITPSKQITMSMADTDLCGSGSEEVIPPSAGAHPNDKPPSTSSVLVMSLVRSLFALCRGVSPSPTSPSTVLFALGDPCSAKDVFFSHTSFSYPLYCSLVLLLCRWVARRVAIPADSELAAVLRQTPSVRLVRGSSYRKPSLSSRPHSDDEDGEEGRGPFCSRAALTDCRLSTLLPASSSHFIQAALGETIGKQFDTISGDNCGEDCIGDVLSYLCTVVGSTGTEEDSRDHAMHRAIATLCDTWGRVKDRVPPKASAPVYITESDVSALLCLYAESSVELASVTLLLALTASTEPADAGEADMAAVTASCRAAYEMTAALQVARFSILYIAPDPASKQVVDRIRALLVALLGLSPSHSSRTQFHLHSSVEPSVDPSRSIAGCGLVAINALGEGELLVREAALATMTEAEVKKCCEDGGTLRETVACTQRPCTDNTRSSGNRAWRSRGEEDTPSTMGDAISVSGAGIRQREEVAQFIAGGDERNAALQLLSLLAEFPDLLVNGWRQWAARVMHDACTLNLSESGKQWLAGEAGKPQQEATPEAILRNLSCETDASLRWPPRRSEGTTPTFLPSANALLAVRGIDEFRIDPPSRWRRCTQGDDHGELAKARLGRAADECDMGPHVAVDAKGAPISALFPFLRQLNHACVPNAVLVLDKAPGHIHGGDGGGIVASLVALRPIESGEEITVSYVPATTALTVSQMELSEVLGFWCRCHICTRRAALLRGHVCQECQQLVYEPESLAESELPTNNFTATGTLEEATVFRHLECCSRRQKIFDVARVTEEGHSVVTRLQLELDDIATQLRSEDEGDVPEKAQDPVVAVVRRLVDLDACVARTLLPTHFLRLRLRLEAFAYSTVAKGLGSTVSAELIELCASTLEELEIFMPANHPLLTGLRMYLVFSRGRHVRAINSADRLARGARHEVCCGAVREQTELMQLPFVVDPLVRRCVARCFQEHFVQLLVWRAEWLTRAGEPGILDSFLSRYSVELEACGVTTAEHMELLSCMEDGTEYT